MNKSVTINGKTTTIASFIDDAGGVYLYFCKTEGNFKYFVKLQDGIDGVVIVKELLANGWNLSVTTFGNWRKEKEKERDWVVQLMDSLIITKDEE